MTFILLAMTLTADPADIKYAKPELLVKASDLKNDKARLAFRILDIRAEADYKAGHIPGAIPVLAGPWSRAVNEGKADAAFWKKQLAAVGVSPTSPTVIVAEDIKEGARVWWILKMAGVQDVRLLDGGWKSYSSAKFETSTEASTAMATPHDWVTAPERLATKDTVINTLKDRTAQIVDGRSTGEYTGDMAMSKNAGRVPGAKHLEWIDFLDPTLKTFKSPTDLKKLISDHKIELDKPCITYCQSGGRAAVVAFGLELMGAKDVKNYYKSWSEWGNDEKLPVEKDKK